MKGRVGGEQQGRDSTQNTSGISEVARADDLTDGQQRPWGLKLRGSDLSRSEGEIISFCNQNLFPHNHFWNTN